MALPTGEKLDLTQGDSWKMENATEIAESLNFRLDEEFKNWLATFIETTTLAGSQSPYLVNLAIKSARDAGLEWRSVSTLKS